MNLRSLLLHVKMSQVANAKRSSSFSIDSLMAKDDHRSVSPALTSNDLKRTASEIDKDTLQHASLPRGHCSPNSISFCRKTSPNHRGQRSSLSIHDGIASSSYREFLPRETRFYDTVGHLKAHSDQRIFSGEASTVRPPMIDPHVGVGHRSSGFFPIGSHPDVAHPRLQGSGCSLPSSVISNAAQRSYETSSCEVAFGNEGAAAAAAFPLYSWLLSRPYFNQRFPAGIHQLSSVDICTIIHV